MVERKKKSYTIIISKINSQEDLLLVPRGFWDFKNRSKSSLGEDVMAPPVGIRGGWSEEMSAWEPYKMFKLEPFKGLWCPSDPTGICLCFSTVCESVVVFFPHLNLLPFLITQFFACFMIQLRGLLDNPVLHNPCNTHMHTAHVLTNLSSP